MLFQTSWDDKGKVASKNGVRAIFLGYFWRICFKRITLACSVVSEMLLESSMRPPSDSARRSSSCWSSARSRVRLATCSVRAETSSSLAAMARFHCTTVCTSRLRRLLSSWLLQLCRLCNTQNWNSHNTRVCLSAVTLQYPQGTLVTISNTSDDW